MSFSMIFKLINKDWQLYRNYMFIYAALGIVSAAIMALPSEFAYYVGVVMLITVLIGASAHLSISSVLVEKKEYQLSFIMGLPVNVVEYAMSKVLGGMWIYLVCWSIVVAATVGIILFSPMPDGLLPLMLIAAGELLAAMTLLLCIGVLTGSEAVTIVSLVVLNLLFNVFLFSVVKIPGIGEFVQGDVAVFNSSVTAVLAAELLVILLALTLTYLIKSRQACFL